MQFRIHCEFLKKTGRASARAHGKLNIKKTEKQKWNAYNKSAGGPLDAQELPG